MNTQLFRFSLTTPATLHDIEAGSSWIGGRSGDFERRRRARPRVITPRQTRPLNFGRASRLSQSLARLGAWVRMGWSRQLAAVDHR
jgi:hypothetical protein